MIGKETAALWFGLGAAFGIAACGSDTPGTSTDGGVTSNPTDAAATDAPTSDGCAAPSGTDPHGLTELYTEDGQVLSLQVAGDLLYFSDSRGVWSLPTSGGTPTPTQVAAVTPGTDPTLRTDMGPFVVTATHVVWADKGADAFTPTIHVKPLTGGSPTDCSFRCSRAHAFGEPRSNGQCRLPDGVQRDELGLDPARRQLPDDAGHQHGFERTSRCRLGRLLFEFLLGPARQ